MKSDTEEPASSDSLHYRSLFNRTVQQASMKTVISIACLILVCAIAGVLSGGGGGYGGYGGYEGGKLM